MRVVLKYDAFIDGVLYRKGNNPPADIPDRYKDILPVNARVIDTKVVEKVKKKEPDVLRDFDEVRAADEAEAKIHNKVHKQVKK